MTRLIKICPVWVWLRSTDDAEKLQAMKKTDAAHVKQIFQFRREKKSAEI